MRTTSAVARKQSHKKIFKAVKGFTHRRKNCYRIAKQAYHHSLLDNYIGRKLKKRDNRSLSIMRINAFCRMHETKYSVFAHKLQEKQINISRKTISELCIHNPIAAHNLLKFLMDDTNQKQIEINQLSNNISV
jgi:large subunit ribosomal protein L20